MKLKLFIFLSLHILSVQLSAQTYKLIAVDSRQNRDTVIFGNPFSFDATVGVDAQLGESNIYGRPYNTLDIRSIQRDSTYHHCLVDQRWSHENVYFDQNIDMKIDYRYTSLDPWRVEPRNRNYEFRINAENYPIYILGLSNGGSFDFHFTLLDSVCNVIQYTYLANNNFTTPDTLFVINNKEYNTILSFIMEPADVKQIQDEKFRIYPNPFSDKFKIENNEWINFKFEIINIIGTVIYKSGTVNKTTELNLSFLNKGLYYLRLTDDEKQVYIRKILKD